MSKLVGGHRVVSKLGSISACSLGTRRSGLGALECLRGLRLAKKRDEFHRLVRNVGRAVRSECKEQCVKSAARLLKFTNHSFPALCEESIRAQWKVGEALAHFGEYEAASKHFRRAATVARRLVEQNNFERRHVRLLSGALSKQISSALLAGKNSRAVSTLKELGGLLEMKLPGARSALISSLKELERSIEGRFPEVACELRRTVVRAMPMRPGCMSSSVVGEVLILSRKLADQGDFSDAFSFLRDVQSALPQDDSPLFLEERVAVAGALLAIASEMSQSPVVESGLKENVSVKKLANEMKDLLDQLSKYDQAIMLYYRLELADRVTQHTGSIDLAKKQLEKVERAATELGITGRGIDPETRILMHSIRGKIALHESRWKDAEEEFMSEVELRSAEFPVQADGLAVCHYWLGLAREELAMLYGFDRALLQRANQDFLSAIQLSPKIGRSSAFEQEVWRHVAECSERLGMTELVEESGRQQSAIQSADLECALEKFSRSFQWKEVLADILSKATSEAKFRPLKRRRGK